MFSEFRRECPECGETRMQGRIVDTNIWLCWNGHRFETQDLSVNTATGYLYEVGLQLRQCASSFEPEVRIVGSICAKDLKNMAIDYLRLRLKEGIS